MPPSTMGTELRATIWPDEHPPEKTATADMTIDVKTQRCLCAFRVTVILEGLGGPSVPRLSPADPTVVGVVPKVIYEKNARRGSSLGQRMKAARRCPMALCASACKRDVLLIFAQI